MSLRTNGGHKGVKKYRSPSSTRFARFFEARPDSGLVARLRKTNFRSQDVRTFGMLTKALAKLGMTYAFDVIDAKALRFDYIQHKELELKTRREIEDFEAEGDAPWWHQEGR